MQRAPTEGMLSSLLGRMLGGGIRGIELVGVLRRYACVCVHGIWCPKYGCRLRRCGGVERVWNDVEKFDCHARV